MKKVRLIYFALSVVFCMSLSTISVKAQAKQSHLFYGGVEMFSLGDTATATKLFNEVLSLNPTHLPSVYYLSRISAMRGDFPKALACMDYIAKFDTLNTQFLNHKLNLLLESRDLGRALDLQQRLVEIEPNNQELYFKGIAMMYQLQNLQKVIEMCKEYERRFGLDPQIIEYHRAAYISSKNYYLALGYMQGVVESFPDDPNYVIVLAELNAALGSTLTAEKLFDDAIHLAPTAYQTYMSKASFYQHGGDTRNYIDVLINAFRKSDMSPEQMASIFKSDFMVPEPYQLYYFKIQELASAMLMRYPDNLQVQLQYGEFLTYTGQIDQALTYYKDLMDNDPSHVEPIEKVMQIHFYLKNYPEALSVAEQGYILFKSSMFLESQVAAQMLIGNSSEAHKLAKQGLKFFKGDSLQSVYFALQGDIYHEDGKDRNAFKSYAKALKLNPDNSVVLNNYAYYLSLQKQDLEFALEMSKRSNELSPDNATYLDTQAWILFCLGEYVDAQLMMQRVMTLDPNPSAEVLMHYGDILYALGDDFLARSYWKKAAEAGASEDEIQLRAMRPKALRPELK